MILIYSAVPPGTLFAIAISVPPGGLAFTWRAIAKNYGVAGNHRNLFVEIFGKIGDNYNMEKQTENGKMFDSNYSHIAATIYLSAVCEPKKYSHKRRDQMLLRLARACGWLELVALQKKHIDNPPY